MARVTWRASAWAWTRARGLRLTVLALLVGRAAIAQPATAPAGARPDATRDATRDTAAEPRPGPPSSPLPLAPLPPLDAQPAAPSASSAEQGERSLAQRIARLSPPGLACSLRATLEVGRRTLVACGASGVWVLELGPPGNDRVIERRRIEGRAVGLFSRGGRVWVEIESLSARPQPRNPR